LEPVVAPNLVPSLDSGEDIVDVVTHLALPRKKNNLMDQKNFDFTKEPIDIDNSYDCKPTISLVPHLTDEELGSYDDKVMNIVMHIQKELKFKMTAEEILLTRKQIAIETRICAVQREIEKPNSDAERINAEQRLDELHTKLDEEFVLLFVNKCNRIEINPTPSLFGPDFFRHEFGTFLIFIMINLDLV
jgi:hypothetical protein